MLASLYRWLRFANIKRPKSNISSSRYCHIYFLSIEGVAQDLGGDRNQESTLSSVYIDQGQIKNALFGVHG